jgi:hypothetical protein
VTQSDCSPIGRKLPRLELIYFDAGGGHRASATALKEVAESQGREWRIDLINFRDLVEPADLIGRLTGFRFEDGYNSFLRSGFTVGSGAMLRLTQALIRRLHRRIVDLLVHHWSHSRPDMVVSLIPNFNREMLKALRQADTASGTCATPMVTIMTDMVDCPPHFWIEPQSQHFICGTEEAVDQAVAIGCPRDRVFRTSGVIVRPDFYRPMELSRASERVQLGLGADRLTGIVLFGSHGCPQVASIASRVAESNLPIQLIFVCGRNEKLRRQIAEMNLPFPSYCVGFTREIPYLMRLADFFVGKPGPGSVSEALVMGLPVIVERNLRTMVQERFNTEWIARNKVGIVLRSFSDIARAISELSDPERLAFYRSTVGKIRNRAVFEIPDILQGLLDNESQSEAAEPNSMFSSELLHAYN